MATDSVSILLQSYHTHTLSDDGDDDTMMMIMTDDNADDASPGMI